MEKLYNTCMELKAISSTNYKKAFLEQHKDDTDFGLLLQFLLNPRIVTGINKAKLKKKLTKNWWTVEVYDLNWLYMYFRNNNTGKDSDIDLCQQYISHYGKDYEDFISSIITKTLKLGVDTKLCNTVYGKDFIPVHEVMQGSPRDKLRLKKGEYFGLTRKLNGVRCTYIDGELISRQGIPFTGLEHIINNLKAIEKTFSKPVVFDGELIRKNIDNLSDNANFALGTGIINSDSADKSCIEMVLFDCLHLEDFKNGVSKEGYCSRREWLDSCEEDSIVWDLKHVSVTPLLYWGNDESMIDDLLAVADKNGWEGLMLNLDAPYECKRSTKLIKIKTFKYSDLRIVGYEEGEGKYVGMLGAVVVEYKKTLVSVGSGFTDEQRTEYWANKEALIGKICEIKYKEETSDKKTGAKSLQFPIWQGLRLDKTEPSLES